MILRNRHFVVSAILVLSGIAGASGASYAASREKTWVGGSQPSVRVKVDPDRRGVEVTLNNKGKDQLPKSIGISFFDENGRKTAYELKAIPATTAPGIIVGANQRSFSGTLSSSAQSYVGFELQIPLGSEAPTVIRSEDLKRAD